MKDAFTQLTTLPVAQASLRELIPQAIGGRRFSLVRDDLMSDVGFIRNRCSSPATWHIRGTGLWVFNPIRDCGTLRAMSPRPTRKRVAKTAKVARPEQPEARAAGQRPIPLLDEARNTEHTGKLQHYIHLADLALKGTTR
jgi:hypothetical protein